MSTTGFDFAHEIAKLDTIDRGLLMMLIRGLEAGIIDAADVQAAAQSNDPHQALCGLIDGAA